MSEKRQAATETQKHLQNAEKHLKEAEHHAANTGDKSLHQTVKRLKTDTQQAHEEIARKLNNSTG